MKTFSPLHAGLRNTLHNQQFPAAQATPRIPSSSARRSQLLSAAPRHSPLSEKNRLRMQAKKSHSPPVRACETPPAQAFVKVQIRSASSHSLFAMMSRSCGTDIRAVLLVISFS